jgi:hypothetical protein
LRLDPPWNLFFGLLAVAGVLNYLPTHYGLAALSVGAGLALEWAELVHPAWARFGPAFPWILALAIWLAEARSSGGEAGRNGVERLWFWLRDRWGLVWGVRVLDRFNRAAESSGWPFRLGWHGIIAEGESSDESSAAAEATLHGLLRRFADRERIEAESARTLDHPRHTG